MENVTVVERMKNRAQEKQIPAVIYGKSIESKSIFVLAADQQAKKWHKGSKFTLDLNGQTLRGTLEEVQMDPVARKIRHLSFHVAGAHDVLKVDVPVTTTHNAPGDSKGGVTTVMINHVPLKGKLSALPEELVIDVSGLNVNDRIMLADVQLPKGVEFAYAKSSHLKDMCVVVCSPSNAATSGASAGGETPEETAATEISQ